MKFRSKKWLLMISLAFILIMAACGSDNGVEGSTTDDNGNGEEVTINGSLSAAGSGGFMYSVGAVIGDVINQQSGSGLDVLEGGGIANLMGVNDQQFEYGLVFSQDINDALEGINNFDKELEDFRVLAALYGGYLQIAVRSDSDIETIEDLEGNGFSPGISGYSAEALAREVLGTYDMSYEDLSRVDFVSTPDGSNLMRDRHIDAISAMFPIPFSAYQEMDTTMGIRILPVGDEQMAALLELNAGYKQMTIPAGTYSGNDEDVNVPGSITLLITHKDTPEDEAYHMVKSMMDKISTFHNLSVALDDFSVEYAYENIVGPIHPGAERYYEEQGVTE